jgi:hypothetical protein
LHLQAPGGSGSSGSADGITCKEEALAQTCRNPSEEVEADKEEDSFDRLFKEEIEADEKRADRYIGLVKSLISGAKGPKEELFPPPPPPPDRKPKPPWRRQVVVFSKTKTSIYVAVSTACFIKISATFF